MGIVHVISNKAEVRQAEIIRQVEEGHSKKKQIQDEIDREDKKKSKYSA